MLASPTRISASNATTSVIIHIYSVEKGHVLHICILPRHVLAYPLITTYLYSVVVVVVVVGLLNC